MIRPASPGLEIYYLFHKEPVRGLILKYYTRPPPPYFIVSATCSSVSVCFIDYDPSVGNMGALAGIKANPRADTGNSAAGTTLSAQGRFDL